MRQELFISNNSESEIKFGSNAAVFHEAIIDVLFKHREEIYKKFIDIKGVFLIDHIAIKIIGPNNKMMIFSIAPSVEYNLIVQGLWKFDGSFSLDFQKNKSLYSWDEAYSIQYANKIKKVKETKHGFTLGFNVCQCIEKSTLIYCFATRSNNAGLLEYYVNHINELSNLGYYGYQSIHNIYTKYCDPILNIDAVTSKLAPKKTFLKLLTNS